MMGLREGVGLEPDETSKVVSLALEEALGVSAAEGDHAVKDEEAAAARRPHDHPIEDLRTLVSFLMDARRPVWGQASRLRQLCACSAAPLQRGDPTNLHLGVRR